MEQSVSVIALLMVVLATHPVRGVKTFDTGAGKVYKLSVTQDVWLESGSVNYNSYEYLIVSKIPRYPNKRSLLQFEDLPSSCPSKNVTSAKMYLYYLYSHKPSFMSIKRVPFIPRYLQVHLVKKRWDESQSTSTMRLRGVPWSSPWLALDGTDAETNPQQRTVTIFPYRPSGFVQFDVTDAVKDWSSGVPNNGLVIRATNELVVGRSNRFASNGNSDTSRHAYVLVHCSDEVGTHTPPSQQPYTIPANTSNTTLEHTAVLNPTSSYNLDDGWSTSNPTFGHTTVARPAHDVKTYDTGAGKVYKLSVIQDVWLESGSVNYNSYGYLIVSKHPGYPNKRSLVQFEDLPSSCPSKKVTSAKMYLYYEYSHKASFMSIKSVPFIPRYLQVHLVKKPWDESQTTSTMRLRGVPWSSPWLALDGTDAEANPQRGTVTIFPYRPKGFVEFDVTNAVKDWSNGVPNYGLVIRAINELDPGRTTRIASNANSDTSRHAYVLVHCSDEIWSDTPPQQPYTTPSRTANTASEYTNPTSGGNDGNGWSTSNPTFGHTTVARPAHDVKTYDTGAGKVYKLSVTQDVWLEKGSVNYNSYEYLIVSKHPGYPNKRSLVQFEDLPSSCPSRKVTSAKMYLYYEYSHKASFMSIKSVPFIPRYLQVHLVKKPWDESQTTSTMRLRGVPWSSPWLALDGTDAEANPKRGTVTIFPYRPKGFVEFDVTNAVKDWSNGVPNNGLVIRAINELDPGRTTRIASNANSDTSRHAYVLVHCSDEIWSDTPPQQTYLNPSRTANTASEHTTVARPAHDVKTYDAGAGKVYKLSVIQDVWLESGSVNYNSYEYLIVSKHPGYPNKRSLVQFEDLPSSCPSKKVTSAKMYLYYEYSHKASFMSIKSVPFIPRYLQVHLVKKPWDESQTTSTMRLRGVPWSSPWLALDGTDAEANPQRGTVTIFPYRPKGFVEFDVTNAVKDWRNGVPNNGLVIRAINELDPGRTTRIASNANSDTSRHAYVLVYCSYNASNNPAEYTKMVMVMVMILIIDWGWLVR